MLGGRSRSWDRIKTVRFEAAEFGHNRLLEPGLAGLVGLGEGDHAQAGRSRGEVTRAELGHFAPLGENHQTRRIGPPPPLDDDVPAGAFAGGYLDHLSRPEPAGELQSRLVVSGPVRVADQLQVLPDVSPLTGGGLLGGAEALFPLGDGPAQTGDAATPLELAE